MPTCEDCCDDRPAERRVAGGAYMGAPPRELGPVQSRGRRGHSVFCPINFK